MNVLLLGSGGREHALSWAIGNSALLTRLFAAPGNAGIAREAEIVDLDPADHDAVIAFCETNTIDLVVIGPEAPLVAGLADDLEAAGIKVFGPSRAAAMLEGSKDFTKKLCAEFNIPTARSQTFDTAEAAISYVRNEGAPIVVKADGLAAGKGVVVAETEDAAVAAVEACFDGAFGAAGAHVVIEDFLQGEEASFFALSDGVNVLPLGGAQDHKRVGEGDTGPNTGGMGAYSPAPILDDAMSARVMAEIIEPAVKGMAERGTPYRGVLFAGLMIDKGRPQLIEFNCRFGDPECQVLMMRLKDDILVLMKATADGMLDRVSARFFDDTALTVVLASKGYPGSYEKNTEIRGLDEAASVKDVEIFHAGTTEEGGQLFASGGRVLNVTALGSSVEEAQTRAYEAASKIDWENGFYRSDIGWRALNREPSEEAG
ncbi:MAG: phosphoribosylamine--glycine ligase [Pseudomonadota bacterium]